MLIFKSGTLLPVGPVDVVSDILLNYNKSQTQLKQEAIFYSDE